jgi:nicotinamidase/pyrazinamidase
MENSLSEEKGGTTLLLVDVQNDFHPGGSLAIKEANEDADRLTKLLRTHRNKIDNIMATLDSHHKLHIAHPGFWVSGDGPGTRHPDPFTLISSEDIVSGKWKPLDIHIATSSLTDEDDTTHLDPMIFKNYDLTIGTDGKIDTSKYVQEYASQLEKNGHFKLCIWPEHCLIGGPGHNIVKSVWDAMQEWCLHSSSQIQFVHKGQHLLTEMYSALSAEVPVTKSTSFNESLLSQLKRSDRILVAGQALSHCVNYTVRDIVDHCTPEERSKITLIVDCCSSVPGFKDSSDEFLNYLKKNGVSICKANDVFM